MLGDGPIWTEILSQRAVKPKTTNFKAVYLFKVIIEKFHKLVDDGIHDLRNISVLLIGPVKSFRFLMGN